MTALAKYEEGGSPIEAESMGLHLAMEICTRHNLHCVTIEGDCKPLIDSINYDDTSPPWRARHVTEDARKIKEKATDITFIYTHRSSNQAAHHLASHTLLSNHSNVISVFGETPDCISTHVFHDMSHTLS
ncbi:mediator of RNA polymerase II transcription subunit 11 [Iris pallida]|uniref:Mediator of RNA polymerase II transcription subunit 11 n=1 Tax=Iris pallida TaxID=29817 RepID=A0AAX6HRG2_IRIPA|nr:mediator of RNA polymerase II transcription subunit 11 [Iris pallida]